MIKSYFLFLLAFLFAAMFVHADPIQQKILPIGVGPGKVGRVIDFRAEQSLPFKSPLKWPITVVPGQILHVSGEIVNADPANQYSWQAILILRFQDQKGEVVVSDTLRYAPQLGGNIVQLAAAARPIPFSFEVQVPAGAVHADISMSRTERQQRVILKWLACVQTKPSSLLVKLAIACAFFGIPLGFFCLKRRFACGAADNPPNDSGFLARSWRFCAVALAVAMAIVFLRNFCSAVERYGQNSIFGFVAGYLIFMALAALLLYGWTCGRRRLAIPLIMIACFLLNVVTIRLTHALYTQTMNYDFAYPGLCLLAPDVRIGHPLEFFYWCNYELLCSFLGKLFCRDIQVAQYLNAVCATAAIYPVFKLSEKTGGFAIAIFTSLLMGSSPVLLLYSTILTNEFLAASLLTFAFYFIVKALEAEGIRLKLHAAVFAGAFLGLAHLMKPIANIFIGAMLVMSMLELARFGRKRGFRCLAVWAATIGGFIVVSECVQSACIEIAKPQVIEKSSGRNIVGALLTGLDADSHGHFDRVKAKRYFVMTEEERRAALKSLLAENYRKLPSLFLEKLDHLYSDFGNMARHMYRSTTAQKSLPEWLYLALFGWHFLMLGLGVLGAAGIAVTRKITDERNMVGIMALLVVGAFTVALLLIEIHERYMSVVYPIIFLIVPYARVWFEKDNRLYQGGAKMAWLLKAWASRRWTKDKEGRGR